MCKSNSTPLGPSFLGNIYARHDFNPGDYGVLKLRRLSGTRTGTSCHQYGNGFAGFPCAVQNEYRSPGQQLLAERPR